MGNSVSRQNKGYKLYITEFHSVPIKQWIVLFIERCSLITATMCAYKLNKGHLYLYFRLKLSEIGVRSWLCRKALVHSVYAQVTRSEPLVKCHQTFWRFKKKSQNFLYVKIIWATEAYKHTVVYIHAFCTKFGHLCIVQIYEVHVLSGLLNLNACIHPRRR